VTDLIGITGTRQEPSPGQHRALWLLLDELLVPGIQLAHGSCKGFDELAHRFAMGLGYTVHVLPGSSPQWVADCEGHFVYPRAPNLVRDKRIVGMCTRLIAGPSGPEAAHPGSGTWATVRMARREGKPVTLIWPDGRVEQEASDGATSDGDRGQRDEPDSLDAGAVTDWRSGASQ